MKFTDLQLNDSLQSGLDAMGFVDATPIQSEAIPKIINGKDLIACAQTGTGKTAAFVLPILHKIAEEQSTGNYVNTLILAPTRELAQQIDQQIEGLSYFTNASSISIYGGGDGQTWVQQKSAIKQGVDIIVATPGRLIALLHSKETDFSQLKHLILDEADRMLDMGFFDDIRKIVKQLSEERQTLLFSATMPPKIRKLSSMILKDAEEITLSISKPAEGVSQKAFMTYNEQKTPILKFLLGSGMYETAIIFASTRDKVKSLSKSLSDLDIPMKAFHSDLQQSERELIMQQFKAKNIRILIGTDIISRGIDVENISLVVNYDVPGDPEDYVHRIGRTARASSKGEAITFINEDDMYKFNRIEKLIEREVMKTSSLPARQGEGPEYRMLANDKKSFRNRKKKNFSHKNKKSKR